MDYSWEIIASKGRFVEGSEVASRAETDVDAARNGVRVFRS